MQACLKYAFLWSCCLLLSTDLHNVLSLHRHYKLWILIVGHLSHKGTISHYHPLGRQLSPERFLASILLLVVIIVTVVIGIVIMIVVVDVGYVDASRQKFGARLVVKFPSILIVILIGLFIPISWALCIHQGHGISVRVPVANVTLSSSAHLLQENTDSVRSNQWMRSIAPSVPLKAEKMPSLISCWMSAKVMASVSDVDILLGGILSTEDNTNKELSWMQIVLMVVIPELEFKIAGVE
ncbi:hypothetical protein Tco_0509393 [Tanacetum coccineum]